MARRAVVKLKEEEMGLKLVETMKMPKIDGDSE